MRYIGTGATGVASDTNTVPAEHFTFSTMVLPSKCEGPLHLHDDVEEVFFMLKGQITLMIQDGDNYTETVLRGTRSRSRCRLEFTAVCLTTAKKRR